MNLGVLIPIVAIIASTCLIIAMMHFRQEGRKSRGGGDDGQLERENERLRRNVERLEERLAVLERIATDPAERTAREIEKLRD